MIVIGYGPTKLENRCKKCYDRFVASPAKCTTCGTHNDEPLQVRNYYFEDEDGTPQISSQAYSDSLEEDGSKEWLFFKTYRLKGGGSV